MMDATKGNKSNDERMKKVRSFYYSVLWGQGSDTQLPSQSYGVLFFLSLIIAQP